MISAFINVRTVRNTPNRIAIFLFRNKTNEAVAPNDESTNSENWDLPIETENPFKRERRLCILCKLNIEPDYKNVRLLSQFQSRYTGRIYGKHITGLCEHKQKKVEHEIIKAQQAGLMGYMTKEPKFVDDPKLFNPNYPFRPHKWT
ncbi:28S ribosomal protein S18c, mitochondrial [Habropoda laboriosa]|uniref:28S ribosomal protein S18c, mitochondrial n=1 Tax=Habropoda laboriosa TaxID=597456 RepID=A0A0L7QQT4_9HYME|nr:PREDICTED: 28S ribosomal protein S18c, mitochondrial [Habropoda laboriosa]KOC60987.1 28S ribosomal protein S18c, mitochondrial [Habropoda laboriosa]